MWFLQLIPDSIFVWLTYALFSLGVFAYIASKALVIIPFISKYKLPVEIAGVVLLVVSAYFYGGVSYREMIADMKEKVAQAEQKSKEANEELAKKTQEKTRVIKETVYVNREIIKEVAGKQLDAVCTLTNGAVSLHDSASNNEVAGRAAATDGTPSKVKASELLDRVVENYGSCHENAAKLEAWQEWYRTQKKIHDDIK